MNADAWRGRRVLVTGHTGFKGAWLTFLLEAAGAHVSGLALEPPSSPSLHALAGSEGDGLDRVDIRDGAAVAARVSAVEPEVIFHLAAQSLVRSAFADPAGTYAVNVLGTANVLDAARKSASIRAAVVVTSDKVYEPHADGRPHGEDSPLGGVDPYSSSKAACELVASAYRRTYFAPAGVGVATARAGNVIGGGDWATDRVVPDVVRALGRSEPVRLRHPDAVRPWQHVLDPLHGYMLLAESLLAAPADAPAALNFGPDPAEACSVAELVERLTAGFGGQPGWSADPEATTAPETAALRIDASRAQETLGWSPQLDLEEGLRWTVEWYRAHAAGENPRQLTLGQIATYRERL
ncbi:MAG: CDP-glucose 4,6-dehydratase [Actinomycetota bacterium]|nr:CDP-glucose 4,6-dehydratase [Actinomycetota bacterium]